MSVKITRTCDGCNKLIKEDEAYIEVDGSLSFYEGNAEQVSAVSPDFCSPACITKWLTNELKSLDAQ